jgi:hypothetical protein
MDHHSLAYFFGRRLSDQWWILGPDGFNDFLGPGCELCQDHRISKNCPVGEED